MHEWDHPPIFWVLTPPPPTPQGPMGTTGGSGTSADIVPTQIIFGVNPCKRCWDIAQKPPKCKNSPLTPIVTKISFPPFLPAGGRQPPKGEKTHSEPEYARMQNLAWIGPRVVEKSLTKKTNKCVSKTDTNPPFAFQIAFLRGTDFAGFLQGGSKSRDLQSEISVRIESNRRIVVYSFSVKFFSIAI